MPQDSTGQRSRFYSWEPTLRIPWIPYEQLCNVVTQWEQAKKPQAYLMAEFSASRFREHYKIRQCQDQVQAPRLCRGLPPNTGS